MCVTHDKDIPWDEEALCRSNRFEEANKQGCSAELCPLSSSQFAPTKDLAPNFLENILMLTSYETFKRLVSCKVEECEGILDFVHKTLWFFTVSSNHVFEQEHRITELEGGLSAISFNTGNPKLDHSSAHGWPEVSAWRSPARESRPSF